MAVKRGPDGVPVNVPTTPHKAKEDSADSNKKTSSLFGSGGSEHSTIPPEKVFRESANQSPKMGGSPFPGDLPTVPGDLGSNSEDVQDFFGGGNEVDDPKTRIAGGKRAAELVSATADLNEGPQVDAMDDPIVGWLVIVDGPGKGSHVKLGNGQNSIGRGSNQRVALDFGDLEISRDKHAVLTYDPRGKSFYLKQGDGTNLAYLNNAPVLAPTPLEAMNTITLGGTTLIFVPLCGDTFDWDQD